MFRPWSKIPYCLLAVSSVLVFAGKADAQQPGRAYFGATLGYEQISDNEIVGIDVEADPGFVIAGQLGYRFGNVRSEAEVGFLSFELDDTGIDAEVYRYTIGLYFDFDLAMSAMPYAGGGVGLATLDAEGSDDETNFTWHAELGIAFPLNQDIELVPSYRYEWIDDADLVVDDPLTGHVFKLGGRLHF